MPGFNALMELIKAKRQDTARFCPVVLHTHSPHSHDYGKRFNGQKKSAIEDEKAFSEAIESCGLAMVALTDHMKCDFACRLSASVKNKDLCILPGMEINLRPPAPWNNFRIHLLIIFPECYSLDQINRIMPSDVPAESKRIGSEEISLGLAELVSMVHKHDGICIAAHIDTDKGIRKTFRQLGQDGIYFCATGEQPSLEDQKKISEQFKDWLLTAGFDGIEVGSDKDRVHYRWISSIAGSSVSIPAILRNDCHCIEDLADRQFHTHVKMTKACFKDLKQALDFPDTRIRFPVDVPTSPCPSIIGLEIISAEGRGFFDNLQVAFSDNLSCLIGPRGSGKSAIIESLRYVFGLNRMLSQLEQSGPDLVKKIRSLQEATLTNSVVRVIYKRDDHQIHILEATFDPKQEYVTKVYDLEGNALDVGDIQSSGKYPLRLFGWSEIETLGREAQRQRDLLDRLIPDLEKALGLRRELRAKVVEKRRSAESSIDRLASILDRNDGEIRKYKEYKADFDRLNTPEIDGLFSGIDNAREKQTVLDKIRNNVKNLLDELRTSSRRSLLEGVDDLARELSETTQKWWLEGDIKPELTVKEGEFAGKISQAIAILETLVTELDNKIKALTDEVSKFEMAVREKIGQEVTKQIAADLRKMAGERLERVTQLRREYSEEWKLFQECIQQWKDDIKALVELQKKVGKMREDKKDEIEKTLNKYATRDMRISIRFDIGRDRKKLIEYLSESGILTREAAGNYKASHLPFRMSLFCTPVDLAGALLAKDSSKIVGKIKIDTDDIEVDKITADKLVESVYPFRQEEDADVPSVNRERLMKIMGLGEVEWDDYESILLNDRPVDTLSPGQRSSAMLPLVALVENAPLIIDQPEDNLDNRLVGRMLVEVLASLKEKRQIIVATHNPNIVVSGDSEQVIVLDALSSSKGTCRYAASIDKTEIVNSVIEIMEGGEEAFRTRSKRYRIALK